VSHNIVWHRGAIGATDRHAVTGGRGVTVWMTGLSGSGKSTIAYLAEKMLVVSGRAAYVLDGDNLRHGLNSDLGFTPEHRAENVRRVGEVARLLADAGVVALVPVISPFAADRKMVREAHEQAGLSFIEVFVDAPLEVCEERDPKGLYARARAGEISDMTGIDSPYEPPEDPDLKLDTEASSPEEMAERLVAEVVAR
jgi:bifunctional enzyme CysN/CysC